MSNQPDTTRAVLTPVTPTESMRYTNALWYAWGRQDAGQALTGPGSDAFRFAEFYLTRVRAYVTEQTHYLRSVQDCFTDWQDGATS